MSSVELSKNTIEILKAMSQVNPNIMIQPGNELMTVAEANNIFVYANVGEQFPNKFGISDLPNLFAVLSNFEQPVLKFSEEKNSSDGASKFIAINEKNSSASFKYFGSPEKVLKILTKKLQMPPTIVEFDVSHNDLQKTIRAGQSAQLPHFMIESNGKGKIELVVGNVDESSANSFRVTVSDIKTEEPFTMVFDINNIKLMGGNYQIAIDPKLVTRFKNTSENKDITYYIAIEKISTVGKVIGHG